MKKIFALFVILAVSFLAINSVPSLEQHRDAVRKKEEGLNIIKTKSYYDVGVISYGRFKVTRSVGLGSKQGYACLGLFDCVACSKIPMSQKQNNLFTRKVSNR